MEFLGVEAHRRNLGHELDDVKTYYNFLLSDPTNVLDESVTTCT